jgi:hypothetical protein
MNEDFDEFMRKNLAGVKRKPFAPNFWYNLVGDLIHVTWKSVASYADFVNRNITIMKEFDSEEIVGVNLYDIYRRKPKASPPVDVPTLNELANKIPNKFVPNFFWCQDSDRIEAYWEDDPSYTERINDQIALLKSFETKKIVGVKLYGVSRNISEVVLEEARENWEEPTDCFTPLPEYWWQDRENPFYD